SAQFEVFNNTFSSGRSINSSSDRSYIHPASTGAVSLRLDCTTRLELHFVDSDSQTSSVRVLIFVVSAPLTMNKTHDLLLTCPEACLLLSVTALAAITTIGRRSSSCWQIISNPPSTWLGSMEALTSNRGLIGPPGQAQEMKEGALR